MSETFRPAFEGRARPSVSYGIPFTDAVAKHASSTFHDASRIYILASASLVRDTAHLSDLRAKLGPKVAGVRIGMRPHTYWSEILTVVSEARELRVDLLVTLGAGSLTDASKIISFALANDVSSPGELESLCPSSPKRRPQEAIREAQIPIVCVPTSLAGGEYSPFAGATNDADGRKYSFSGPGILCPALVILDPALALSTPPKIWLSTGVKAIDHCVETLCSLQSDEGADADARKGLGKLVPALLRCAADKDGKDDGARLESQLGVVDAMSACSRGVPLGASHGIGHRKQRPVLFTTPFSANHSPRTPLFLCFRHSGLGVRRNMLQEHLFLKNADSG